MPKLTTAHLTIADWKKIKKFAKVNKVTMREALHLILKQAGL